MLAPASMCAAWGDAALRSHDSAARSERGKRRRRGAGPQRGWERRPSRSAAGPSPAATNKRREGEGAAPPGARREGGGRGPRRRGAHPRPPSAPGPRGTAAFAPRGRARPGEGTARGGGWETPERGRGKAGRALLALLEPSSGRPLGATPGTTRAAAGARSGAGGTRLGPRNGRRPAGSVSPEAAGRGNAAAARRGARGARDLNGDGWL